MTINVLHRNVDIKKDKIRKDNRKVKESKKIML